MTFNLGINYPTFNKTTFNRKDSKQNESSTENKTNQNNYYNNYNNNNNSISMLDVLAMQNGYETGINSIKGTKNFSKIAEMLQAGNKEDVKEMGAAAVPYLTAIVKDTSQSMNTRVDAIATLAKLVDEGKAPASCLVSLLKDPNCKDMAERALANVGKEAMPAVKQLLKSGDPELKQSAVNILNDMKDAWAGYENDPKWGAECQELLPEVDKLLNKVNNEDSNQNNIYNSNNSSNEELEHAGITRQFLQI